MKLTINKKTYNTEKDNKALLEYLLRFSIVRFNNNEEKELIRKILEKAEYFEGERSEVMLLCKKCGNRYKSFTDGALLHCECMNMYWKSDGKVVWIDADPDKFNVLLTSPECYKS